MRAEISLSDLRSKSVSRSAGDAEQYVLRCTLGYAGVVLTRRGVRALVLADDAAEARRESLARAGDVNVRVGKRRTPELELVVRALEGEDVRVPLDVQGTAFQERVWRALVAIPFGETTTYAKLALRAGSPNAVRAVGTACGANPVSVVVPCHRALRADGGLGGYRWGLARKQRLLAREADSVVSPKRRQGSTR